MNTNMNIRDKIQTSLGNMRIYADKMLQNDLKIKSQKYVKDPVNKRMVVLLDCNSNLPEDLDIRVKDHRLVIEAFIDIFQDPPLRVHNIDKNILYDYNAVGLEIGFSEVALPRSYDFEIISYRVMRPRMLMVILKYDKKLKKQNLDN